MKTNTSTKGIRRNQGHIFRASTDTDFEHILELARLGAAHSCKHAVCMEKHRQMLKAEGETDERLHKFTNWRQSPAFTGREKAALGLSESISSKQSEEILHEAVGVAHRHFDTSEMVRLTLAIIAVNDWINLRLDSPIRVLIVEDDPLDQDLLCHQLRKAGMEKNISFVSDGLEAFNLLSDSHGELFRRGLVAIFLDLRLPGLNGIELLRRIRNLPGMENFPVIVMTSSNDPRDMAECENLKVVSYVQKPVTYSSFSRAVANVFHAIKA